MQLLIDIKGFEFDGSEAELGLSPEKIRRLIADRLGEALTAKPLAPGYWIHRAEIDVSAEPDLDAIATEAKKRGDAATVALVAEVREFRAERAEIRAMSHTFGCERPGSGRGCPCKAPQKG